MRIKEYKKLMKTIIVYIKLVKYVAMKILKDQNSLLLFLFAPLLYPILYGAVYLNKIEKDVPIGVCDYDNSSLSRQLIREIDASQTMMVAEYLPDKTAIREKMSQQKIHAAVIIPKNFSENIKSGKGTNVNVILTPGRMLVLGDIGIPISQIVSNFGGRITANHLAGLNVPVVQNKNLASPLKIDFQYLNNPYVTYGDMILPGIMMIILLQLVVIATAGSTAKEWTLNKWGDVFSLSKNPFLIITSRVLLYILSFVVFGTFMKVVLGNIFDIHFAGNAIDILAVSTLSIIAASLFGIFIGSFFHHRITVFTILGFATYPFFMMTGYAWPQSQLPEVIRWISYMIPLTPFMQAMMSVTQMGMS